MSAKHLSYSDLTGLVIEAAYNVYNEMRFGFLESVYENCLLHVLQQRGCVVQNQVPVDVFFRERK